MKRILGTVGLVVMLGGGLVACSSAPAGGSSNADDGKQGNNVVINNKPYAFYLTLPNGAKVLCAGVEDLHYGSNPGNFNCDWTNAQGLNKAAPST